jgi:hypothetical protein
MDGLVRLWTMTALDAARHSEQARSQHHQAQEPSLPATLGKAGAWSRWMSNRDRDGSEGAAGIPTLRQAGTTGS